LKNLKICSDSFLGARPRAVPTKRRRTQENPESRQQPAGGRGMDPSRRIDFPDISKQPELTEKVGWFNLGLNRFF
jgi:hypothetical protein